MQIAGKSVELSEANNWSGATEAPAGEKWTIEKPDGYTVSDFGNGSSATKVVYRHPVKTTAMKPTSIVWVDDDNAAGLRPDSVRINLLADNVICYTPRTVKGTTVSWGNLLVPMYRKG